MDTDSRKAANTRSVLLLLSCIPAVILIRCYHAYASDGGAMRYLALLLIPLFCALYAWWLWAPPGRDAEDACHARRREWLMSILAALIFFAAWPTSLVFDDGAIVLRYMENFAAGHFYSYNPGGPPVFGISGFLHGVLAGALAYTHLLTPLNSVFASNFLGLVLVYRFTFRILAHHIKDESWIFPAWALAVLASPPFILNAKQGMEAPLHLGIALACCYYYFSNSRWLWLTLALAIMSKLDAVPLVAVLGVATLVKHRRALRPFSWRNPFWRDAALGFVIPLATWVLFTWAVFGSPLPNTGVAKYMLHQDSSGAWWAFLTGVSDPWTQSVCLAVFAGYLVWIFVHRNYRALEYLVPGFAALGIYLLYLAFNPEERMSWYYVLPDYLTKLQTLLLASILLRPLAVRWTAPTATALFSLFCCFLLPYTLVQTAGDVRAITVAQAEWMMAGEWIDEHAPKDATVEVGLGYPAWKSGRKVVDQRGLNSPEFLAWVLARKDTPPPQRPLSDYIVTFNPWPSHLKAGAVSYAFVRGYYNYTQFHGMPLYIYEQSDHPRSTIDRFLMQDEIQSDGQIVQNNAHLLVAGTRILIRPHERSFQGGKFVCGLLLNKAPTRLQATFLCDPGATGRQPWTQPVGEITLPPGIPGDYRNFSREWQLELPERTLLEDEREIIEITAADSAGKPGTVWLLAPMIAGPVD